MEGRTLDDATLRAYLLGRLEADSPLLEAIDERSLADEYFSESLDVIEDELIEEYLEDTLNAADRAAVERYFLRPQERQRKLHRARLLHDHFQHGADTQSSLSAPHVPCSAVSFAAFRHFVPYRYLVGLAAALLIIITGASNVMLRLQLSSRVHQSEQQLAQERQRADTLQQRLQSSLALAEPPAVLSLLQPGTRRGAAQVPQLTLSSGIRNVRIEIALLSGNPGPYHVQLEQAGRELWSQQGVLASTAHGGAILRFDAPANAFGPGETRALVTDPTGVVLSYWFVVSK